MGRIRSKILEIYFSLVENLFAYGDSNLSMLTRPYNV